MTVDFNMSTGILNTSQVNNKLGMDSTLYGEVILLMTFLEQMIQIMSEQCFLNPGDNDSINSDNGSDVIISHGGGGTFYGNAGNDVIILDEYNNSYITHHAYGGSGADIVAFGLAEDVVYGGGGECGLSSSNCE